MRTIATRLPSLLLLAIAGLGLAWPGAYTHADELSVQAVRNGALVQVQAEATVRAVWPTVWSTLTDYERLPGFIPGLHTSRVLARSGRTVTVEQTGAASLLFLELPIDVTVESTENPPRLEVRRIAGSLRHLEGYYETRIIDNGAAVRLRWVGSISPQFDLPPVISETLVRLSIREQFEGMVREIERREALRLQGLPWTPPPEMMRHAPAQRELDR